jgi:glycerol kinase
MTKFLAIDQGTTSTKAIVFDESLSSLKRYSEKIDTMFPKSGWVEQKPQNILQTVKSAINKTISDDVVGLGITNQRETVVIWDRASGNPILQCYRLAR